MERAYEWIYILTCPDADAQVHSYCVASARRRWLALFRLQNSCNARMKSCLPNLAILFLQQQLLRQAGQMLWARSHGHGHGVFILATGADWFLTCKPAPLQRQTPCLKPCKGSWALKRICQFQRALFKAPPRSSMMATWLFGTIE